MNYTNLMSILSDCCHKKIKITIFFMNGMIIESNGNTGVYETDNGLDLDDKRYFEYYACAVFITKIVRNPNQISFDPEFGEIKVGALIEISELNEPLRIEKMDGTVLWQKEKNSD